MSVLKLRSVLTISHLVVFQGVPERFSKTEELIEVLTVVIFNSSVQHAAVNFGQYDEYGFAPNYPAIIRTPLPKDKVSLLDKNHTEPILVDRLNLTVIHFCITASSN